MAKKVKGKPHASVPSKNTFAESLQKIGYRFSLPRVFEDFVTLAIAACTQNPLTKQSWYEEEYLETISYYKDSDLRHEFPKAFAYLITEMEQRVHSGLGNDVLGEFFEQHISNGRNGQFFTHIPSASSWRQQPIRTKLAIRRMWKAGHSGLSTHHVALAGCWSHPIGLMATGTGIMGLILTGNV